jgi:tetratricopeptide (TPR) repeat protein
MTMKRLLLPIVLLCVLTSSAAAEDATAFEASGTKHFQLAEYDAAIKDFKEAFRISDAPGYLYNIAQAYRLKGDCRSAATFYKNYLRRTPDAANAAQVRARVTEMDACAAKQPPDPVPTTTEPPPVTTEPPPVTTVTPPLTPPEQPPPQPEGGGRGWMTYTGIAGMGIGALALGLGVKFMLDGKSANSDLEEKCMISCTGAEALAIQQKGKDANRNAVISSVAGGVFLVGGVVLFVLSRGGGSSGDTEPAVAVSVTGSGAAASYAWRF